MPSFRDGVQWGVFMGTYDQSEHPSDELRRSILLSKILMVISDQLEDEPLAETLLNVITDFWFEEDSEAL